MKNTEITQAIYRLSGTYNFEVSGGDLSTLRWYSDLPHPTDAEILAEIDRQPVIDARTAAIERVESGYRQALRSFAHAGATWDASDDSAMVLRDLLNRLANGQGLPRGKSVVTLRDTTGATHDMDAAAIIDLGAAGSDHRDECLEIRLSLLDQARSADTVAEAEAIDWPT